MIDFLKIKDIITVLPLLIIYILPGYIFISIKDFILNKKPIEDKNILLKSIVISYVIVNLEKLISIHFSRKDMDISSPKSIIITFVLSIIIAYVYSMVLYCPRTTKLLKFLKITRSLKLDILTEIIDFDKGTWVRVFLNTEEIIYVGKIRKFEQITDASCYIVLSNFITYNYENELFVDNENCNTEWVLLSVKDNYRIELVYKSSSKKIID